MDQLLLEGLHRKLNVVFSVVLFTFLLQLFMVYNVLSMCEQAKQQDHSELRDIKELYYQLSMMNERVEELEVQPSGNRP